MEIEVELLKAAPIHMILANDETTAVTDRAINLKLKIKSNFMNVTY